MAKKQREYVDEDHRVMGPYYDLCEEYSDASSTKVMKSRLIQLIEKDPDFLDTYLFLSQILRDEDKLAEAEELLNDAYDRALKLITDKNGNWPDILEWGWLENRHIIRTILNKAISLWDKGGTEEALDLFRKLLRTNPGDNVGARDFILAIRMNMTFEEFENRFNKSGYYDMELTDWFDKNYKNFPDEFHGWEKAVEECT